jgi:hypothetical protein
VGFPIRKSADQSFFAAPHGLSQRSTSFIASQRQGIHRMPLRHLIALIINTHPLGSGTVRAPLKLALLQTVRPAGYRLERPACFGSFRRRAVKQPTWQRARTSSCRDFRRGTISHCPMLGDCASIRDVHHDRLSERSYLFTMSDIWKSKLTHAAALRRSAMRNCFLDGRAGTQLVEPIGIEPTTSCLQSTRSPN